MKRLVVCCDGTWNDADSGEADTNVALIARSIHANVGTEGVPQLVLYLRGVGSTGLLAQRVFDGATGLGIDDNIRSAYMFLAQNYVPGDEIFLFGFSRGAFTARSVAGFVGSCGLLQRQTLGVLSKAWAYYRTVENRSPQDFASRYKTSCHTDVTIKFLGVWDTVGALGIPTHLINSISAKMYAFHDTSPSKIIRHGCHALAIDEERDEFVPTFWTGTVPNGNCIEQVWFAGAHSDVGGGYIDRALADIPLLWIARKAEGNGLVLDWTMLPDRTRENDRRNEAQAPNHESRVGWAMKDLLTPTLRCVCERQFETSWYEKLYRPRAKDGAFLPTINEAVHPSVLVRFGQDAAFSTDDAKRSFISKRYAPKNLMPLFIAAGQLAPGIATAR